MCNIINLSDLNLHGQLTFLVKRHNIVTIPTPVASGQNNFPKAIRTLLILCRKNVIIHLGFHNCVGHTSIIILVKEVQINCCTKYNIEYKHTAC